MSKPLQIVTYTPGDHSALCAFMSDLQDLERGWSSDRSPGPEMATDHIDYLLELAQRSKGQAFVAKLDDQLVGFLFVVIESLDEGDVHLIERYRRYGVVTDLYVADEARHQGVARRLIDAAERHVRQAGLSRLLITTLAQNQIAQEAYARLGYESYTVTMCKTL